MNRKMAPGSLARLNGQPVTILHSTERRTHYIPGWHFWTAAYTEDFVPVDFEREDLG